jgi:hypothetical protein
MRTRLPLFLLLASALTFLGSLFLPWRSTHAATLSVGSPSLPATIGGGQIDGWVSGAGDVAVVLVVAIVIAAVATLRRPAISARLPFATLSVALGYFVAAVAVEVHRLSQQIGGFTGFARVPATSWTYGFYLGLASGVVALFSGLAVRPSESRPPRGVADVVAAALGIALLVSFLLPWLGFKSPPSFSGYPGIVYASVAIAALGLILGAPFLHREAGRPWRLPFAIAVAILAGGAFSATAFGAVHKYGAWVGIGCAAALVVLEAGVARPLRLPEPPRGWAAVRVGAAGLLLAALFLPWQQFGPGETTNGWYDVAGAAAGSLCLVLIATPALPVLEDYVVDLVVAVALLVSALGTTSRENAFIRIGYGAFIGLAAAGVLLVAVFMRWRPGPIDGGRLRARAVPLTASILCVAAVIVPWWNVLPRDWANQAVPLPGWMGVPGLLLSLYLVRLWWQRVGGASVTGNRLTLVPLTLLTLASLELIRFRGDYDVAWSAIILVGLSLLLAVLGRTEERGGLDGLRVPDEIWRVDRLREPES